MSVTTSIGVIQIFGHTPNCRQRFCRHRQDSNRSIRCCKQWQYRMKLPRTQRMGLVSSSLCSTCLHKRRAIGRGRTHCSPILGSYFGHMSNIPCNREKGFSSYPPRACCGRCWGISGGATASAVSTDTDIGRLAGHCGAAVPAEAAACDQSHSVEISHSDRLTPSRMSLQGK